MPICTNCHTTIVLGGTEAGGHRFCSAECAAGWASLGEPGRRAAAPVPPGSAARRALLVAGLLACAGVSAVALTMGVWQLAFWNARNSASGGPFLVSLVAVLACRLLLHARYRKVETVPGFVRALHHTCNLAALALPLAGVSAVLGDSRAEVAAATMRLDLRTLVALQDSLHATSGRYATGIDAEFFRPSSGSVGFAIEGTPDGWSASVRHGFTPQTCAVFVGTRPRPPAEAERVPACTRPPLDAPRLLGTLVLLAVGLTGATLAASRLGPPRATWPG